MSHEFVPFARGADLVGPLHLVTTAPRNVALLCVQVALELPPIYLGLVQLNGKGYEFLGCHEILGVQSPKNAAHHPHHPHLSCKRCPHGSSRSTASVTRSNSKPWVIRPTPAPQSRAEENFPGSLLNASSALQGYVPTCKDMIGLCIHRSSPGCLSQKSSSWPRQLISDEKSNFVHLTNLKTTNQITHLLTQKNWVDSSFVNQDKSQQVYITGKAQASANHRTTLV